jgi:hypothetical protein
VDGEKAKPLTRLPSERLIALDGTSGAAVLAAARKALAAIPPAARGGISRWDASGVFAELAMAEVDAGQPSPRTLLLLYAADLAFRIRWEIAPTMAAGRVVIAAPYVDTGLAFGRAVGLPSSWLSNLFLFAPRPSERHIVEHNPTRTRRGREGFVEMICDRWIEPRGRRQEIVDQVAAHLGAADRRFRRRHLKRGLPARDPR